MDCTHCMNTRKRTVRLYFVKYPKLFYNNINIIYSFACLNNSYINSTYSYVISDPTQFYNSTNIDRIGVLAKSQNGASQTGDFIFNVGVYY